MSSSFGTMVRVHVFGQSHSQAIGCVLEGLPAGETIDFDELAAFMRRRSPGGSVWSTPRSEADEVHVLSGLNDAGQTCGTPLALVINNTDTRSKDYSELYRFPRPGHADVTAWSRWHGAQDVRGGGHFSGRLTAPLVAAGGICKQVLLRRGVRVFSHLFKVAGIYDEPFDSVTPDVDKLVSLATSTFPTVDANAGNRMVEAIASARAEGDSLGGVVECVALGLPAGIGSPMFDGIENRIAKAVFGIPAVKALEFGAGFDLADMRGSQSNDPMFVRDDGSVGFSSNNNGGVLGGITNAMPVVFRVAFKPTPSIAKDQQTVDLFDGRDATLSVTGRHDPCVAVRAVPVVEAVCALVLADAMACDGRLASEFEQTSADVDRLFPSTGHDHHTTAESEAPFDDRP